MQSISAIASCEIYGTIIIVLSRCDDEVSGKPSDTAYKKQIRFSIVSGNAEVSCLSGGNPFRCGNRKIRVWKYAFYNFISGAVTVASCSTLASNNRISRRLMFQEINAFDGDSWLTK